MSSARTAFGGGDVAERRSCGHVASVVEDVDGGAGDAFGGGPAQHRVEMLVVRVHVAVGVQPEQVQRAGAAMLDRLVPHLGLEDRSRLDRPVHQLGALGEDPAGAERVVADLAVAHVVIGWQPDGRPVRCQFGVQLAAGQLVEGRCVGDGDRVAGIGWSDADPVGDHEQQRPRSTGERWMLAEFQRHTRQSTDGSEATAGAGDAILR